MNILTCQRSRLTTMETLGFLIHINSSLVLSEPLATRVAADAKMFVCGTYLTKARAED